MRVFGNIMNRIQEDMNMPEPEVGMGCTIFCYSDRDAGTIVEIVSTFKSGKLAGKAKLIAVQEDRAERTDKLGMTDSGQTYEFSRNPDAPRKFFGRKRDGGWVEATKDGKLTKGNGLGINHRSKYHDFSF